MPDRDLSPSPAELERVRALVGAVEPDLVALSHAPGGRARAGVRGAPLGRAVRRAARVARARGGAQGVRPADRVRRARRDDRGPHVVICAEYDALPEVGHACGHNVIAASAVGAGIAVAALAEEIGLRVTVLGTPAEEVGGGKVDLIRAGALEGVDAAMMVHPSPFDDHAPSALAIEEWHVVVHGRTSHASAAPELGRNALDGLVARLHVDRLAASALPAAPAGARHHHPRRCGTEHRPRPRRGVVLPARRRRGRPGGPRGRVRACLEGAAQASGTTVGHHAGRQRLRADRRPPGLAAAFSAACLALGRAYTPDPQGGLAGSTDFGNVSQLVPGLHADLAVHSWPVVNHQKEFAEHCVTEAGDRTMLEGAMALALTALRVAADPTILARSPPS